MRQPVLESASLLSPNKRHLMGDAVFPCKGFVINASQRCGQALILLPLCMCIRSASWKPPRQI